MPATATDRIDGLTTSVAVKAPCRVGTTGPITLYGLQTIDGSSLAVNDRVLVKDQVDAWQNGIYSVQTTAWRRTPDFDGARDAVSGTVVILTEGLVNGRFWEVVAVDPVRIGNSSITFIPTIISDSDTVYFLQSGSGAVRRTLQEKAREVVTIEDFGGRADDPLFDNATALENAAATAAGRPIRIMSGRVYSILRQVTITQKLHLVGGGTLLMSIEGSSDTVLQLKTLISEDIIYDGGNKAANLIQCTDGRLVMNDGAVQNLYPSAATPNGVIAVNAFNCRRVHISGTDFTSICGPLNGTVGDSDGAIAAIQISAGCPHGLIENCVFDDINNRATVGGALQYEDADAIRLFSSGLGAPTQNVKVRNSRFTRIGKRGLKALVPAGSYLEFSNNQVASQYTGTVDDPTTQGNGMFSIVSVFGGRVDFNQNTLTAGVCQFGIDATGADVESVRVSGNTYRPEFHKQVNTSLTRFVYVASVSDACTLEVSGNDAAGVFTDVTSEAKSNNISSNQSLESSGPGVNIVMGGTSIITGNTIKQTAGKDPATEGGYGVYLAPGTVSAAVDGNTYVGKYDGVYFANHPAAFRATVTGSTFIGLARADVFYNLGTNRQYVTEWGNATPAGNPINSMRVSNATVVGAAGPGAALPATPLAYWILYLNGTQVKIPYYNV